MDPDLGADDLDYFSCPVLHSAGVYNKQMDAVMTDFDLLGEYAERRSEAAFTALVERHVGLIYSAALRQVRDPQLAEEVTRATFIILARKARLLRRGTSLSGWLYRTTHFAANGALRTEHRRKQREQKAAEMDTTSADESAWEQIAPCLDEAMAQLGDKDRQAMLLRFFENKSFGQVGMALGMSEEAARKRVARGLERLRGLLLGRGVALSAAVIAAGISANSVHAAPAALVTSAVSAVKGSAATASTLAITKATLKAMAWIKLKTAVGVGAGILLAAGAVTVATTLQGAKTEHFDAAAQFSRYLNPSGPWSYGWCQTTSYSNPKPEAELHLYEQSGTKDVEGVVAWTRNGGDPDVFFNATNKVLHPRGTMTLKPKQLALHPGPAREFSVVRWTAPRAGVCRIKGSFEGISGFNGAPPATTDLMIRHRNLALFYEGLGGQRQAFDLRPKVAAGETIDFLVGDRNNDSGTDATALELKITLE
jgi:RNA polymerase sigma factor (sigma-70 family)